MTIHTTFQTELCELQVVGGEAGIQRVHMQAQQYFLPVPAGSREDAGAALFVAAREQLQAYFAGELRSFDLPIDLHGSPSQVALWTALIDIPYGQTTTYGALAAALGRPGQAQAIGQGVGHNPVAIIVPCHRVIGADGSLTGYAGGLPRKRRLLELEGVLQPTLL